MTVLILACKTNVIGVYCGVSSRVALPWATWLHGNLAARPRRRASGFFRRPGLVPDGRLVTTLLVAVEIGGVLVGRKPVEEGAFGVCGQLLDHFGYRVTVVASEASELCLGLNADEELDALLGTVDAKMAIAIALLLLGRGQSHDHPLGYGVTDKAGPDWLHRNR